MPDMIQPVGAMIKAPDPNQAFSTMSSILGLKQQQQALTQGQQQIQGTAMANQGTAMSLGERQKVQQILSSGVDDQGNSIKDEDGTPDPDKAMKWMPRVAPTTYPAYLEGIQKTEASKLGLKKSAADLGQTYRDQIGGMLQSGVNDPSFNSQKAAALLTPYGAQNPDAAPAITHALSLLRGLDTVKTGDPKADLQKKNDMLVHTIQAFKPSLANQPTTVDTNAAIQPGSQQPLTGAITPAGQPIAKQVGPGATPVTDAFGRTSVFNPQNNTVAPIGTGPQGTTPSSFTQPVADQHQVQNDIDTARKAGDAAPQVRSINDKLLSLSSQTQTGPGTQTVQKIAAALNLPSGSNFQEINAYLERQAAAAGQAMGLPNTNAGLHASQQASGTTEYNPAALQEKIKFADALNSGAFAYRQGLDKLVGTGATPDYSKYQAFRSAWAQNFSPDVFRAEDALRRGDKKELVSIKNEIGSRGMAEMRRKSDNLRMLENGQIPQ